MTDKRTRPTRRDLLIVIGQLQGMIGRLKGICHDDRNMMQADQRDPLIEEALRLCTDARGYDPPLDGKKSRNGWDEKPEEPKDR